MSLRDVPRQLALPLRARSARRAAEAPLRPGLEPRGVTIDLREVLDRLVGEYFDGRLEVDITWGRRPRRRRRKARRRRSIRLGSYRYDARLIRVHRALDHPDVPRFVVESIVHHELVHAALPEPARGRGGRRSIHTPEFRLLERRFARYREAEAWLAANLETLLGRS